SRVSGVLEKLHVDVGDTVQAGALLAELDDRDIQLNLAVLHARVAELDAQLDYSHALLERNRAVPTLAAVERERLEADLAANAARLEQARAAVAAEELRLSWTRVTAPIAGTIASVSTQQGETIAASFAAPTFLTLIDLGRLEIQAYVDEADIGRIAPGHAVRFGVDTWPGVDFAGTVRTIYPKAELVGNVVNYIVLVDIDTSGDYLLRPEMTAHLQFVIRDVSDALTVPRSALFSQNGGYHVLVPRGSVWEKQPLQLGIVNSSVVEVVAGLREGDAYLSDRQQWLDTQSAK
ncbi:MAG: efflux RND transporter periplasmic adaptor subunit, partial [Pseudomonadota bacterium]|nr:efflux RND transporter periplasmic adaptor subunit [Pseudomonadota bacterium]